MKFITEKKQKEIDKLIIKKLMFALYIGALKKRKQSYQAMAEDIFYSDNVMLPPEVKKVLYG